MQQTQNGELIIASNRLPVVMRAEAEGEYTAEAASGGLVAALAPVLKQQGGAWIGWPGIADVPVVTLRRALSDAITGYEILPVDLSSEERDAFYLGFSNEIVWPLFHDLTTNCNFDPAYWEVYERVNQKFASAIAERVRPGDQVWVHDYHLMRVGAELRALGVDNRVGFFLHIPFPGADTFRRLPWRSPIADGLLSFDLLGFQTERDVDNFTDSMGSLGPFERVGGADDGVRTYRRPERDHVTRVGAFPIGVDLERERREAESPEAQRAAEALRADVGSRHLLLGVDRLDYTKGIPHRLEAFREALRRYPALRGAATLVQLVVPSREDIPEYSALREEIEQLVGAINGELGAPGWVPVIYMHTTVERVKLRGWYQAADVALITPLKDGMNLVAKEFCAAHGDERGVLILSEFAGAAAQLEEHALIVNPHDRVGTADAIARACGMGFEEQRRRMRPMREIVASTDVFFWARSFLGELARPMSDVDPVTGAPPGHPIARA